jgi:hypothetical protein
MFWYSAAPAFKPVAMMMRVFYPIPETMTAMRPLHITAYFAGALHGASRTVASIS